VTVRQKIFCQKISSNFLGVLAKRKKKWLHFFGLVICTVVILATMGLGNNADFFIVGSIFWGNKAPGGVGLLFWDQIFCHWRFFYRLKSSRCSITMYVTWSENKLNLFFVSVPIFFKFNFNFSIFRDKRNSFPRHEEGASDILEDV